MSKTKKYNKLFGGLLIHSLILSFSPLLFRAWTDDLNIVLTLATLAAFVPIFLSMGKQEFLKQLTEKREKVNPIMLILLLLAPMGTNIIGAMLGIGMNKLLALAGLSITQTGAEMAKEVAESPGFFLALYTCLIAPVFEEFAFRNNLLRGMEKPRPWLAVILSGVMFALMHGNLEQSVSLIATAIFFPYLAKRYSMWVPIVAHIANNTIFYIFSAFKPAAGSLLDTVNNIITFGGIIAFIVVLISAIRYIIKDIRGAKIADPNSAQESEQISIDTQKKPAYVKNIFFILYFVYWLVMIVLNDFVL